MSVHAETRNGRRIFKVRWREGERNRSRSFDLRRDAELFEADLRRRRQLGTLHALDAGRVTLNEYVIGTWVPVHVAGLARATQEHYVRTYDLHIAPYIGDVELRNISAETVARWQAERLGAGAGPVAARHALNLLGSIVQRAVEAERLPANPVRLVRKAPIPRSAEVEPLAPRTIEAMRTYLVADGSEHPMRDATLVSLLAYAGLRPGEALAIRWEDVRDRTLFVRRAASFGEEKGTKTNANRTVRLLDPLRRDLAAWRLVCGRPHERTLIVPGDAGAIWSKAAYQSWRRRAFRRALTAAGVEHARPYDLRHSFASLLLHEGRSVVYVARQLGHDARLTLGRYGHVMDELEDQPHAQAESVIAAARQPLVPAVFPATVATPTAS
jgi:integrase